MNSFGIGRDYFDPEMFHYVSIGSGASPASSFIFIVVAFSLALRPPWRASA